MILQFYIISKTPDKIHQKRPMKFIKIARRLLSDSIFIGIFAPKTNDYGISKKNC